MVGPSPTMTVLLYECCHRPINSALQAALHHPPRPRRDRGHEPVVRVRRDPAGHGARVQASMRRGKRCCRAACSWASSRARWRWRRAGWPTGSIRAACSRICGVLAALCNAALLIAPIGGTIAILLRFLTGLLLAGVYPVGMKIAVGWGTKDRGLLVGLLVGALTVGSALPHLAAYLGGADWRGVDRRDLGARSARRIAGTAVRPRAAPCARAALLDPRHRARLDQPAHPPYLSRLFRPYVGALRHVGVGRRRGGRVLWRTAGRSGGDASCQADRLPRHRARRPHLRAGRLGRRPHRQGAGHHHRHGAQRLGRDRHRAQLRRADLADLRPHHHLGDFRDPGFGAVLRAGRRRLAARPRRQRR